MSVPVLLVRLLPGVVGESRRLVHAVPVPIGGPVPERLTAYCGEQIQPGQAETLNGPAGMPVCRACSLRRPIGS